MKLKSLIVAVGMAAAASMAMAQSDAHQPSKDTSGQPTKDAKAPAGQPQLPPGWTMEDMQACEAAAKAGSQHQHLAKSAGTWTSKGQMWMAPGTEPMPMESTTTITPIMDGRYVKVETAGDMPGMGPFNGFGINGFDNVTQKFVSTWIDNCGTGIATCAGELSPDGKTMTWKYTYNCPVTKKPTTMRHVEKMTGEKTMTMDMFTVDPKSGKEFKMLSFNCTKK